VINLITRTKAYYRNGRSLEICIGYENNNNYITVKCCKRCDITSLFCDLTPPVLHEPGTLSRSVPYQNDPYKTLKTTRNTQNNKTQQTMPSLSCNDIILHMRIFQGLLLLIIALGPKCDYTFRRAIMSPETV